MLYKAYIFLDYICTIYILYQKFQIYRSNGTSDYEVSFSKVIIQGGGRLRIESGQAGPITLRGDYLEVESGASISADWANFNVTDVNVHILQTLSVLVYMSLGKTFIPLLGRGN